MDDTEVTAPSSTRAQSFYDVSPLAVPTEIGKTRAVV